MQATKVLAYDDTNSININVYGELAYYYPSCAIPVTPDHEGIIDCSCGLMATKDKCLTNDRLFVAVVNRSVEINLQVNLSM